MEYISTGNRLTKPPLIFNAKRFKDKKVQMSVMDYFENVGVCFVRENIERFGDFYRMYDNDLSYTELREFAPDLERFSDFLGDYDIPTHVRHHDIIGGIVNSLVGKLLNLQDKFHPTDTGEIAEGEFVDNLTRILHETLASVIQNSVKVGMAKAGINPDEQRQFQSEEEQQAYIQQIQQIESEYTPKGALEGLKKDFTTIGVKWAEATLEKDEEELEFQELYIECFKNFLLSGVCAKITKVVNDSYKSFAIDARKLFHSRDTGKKYLHDFSYAGTVDYITADQVIERHNTRLSPKVIEEILGDGDLFKDINGFGEYALGSAQDLANGVFHKREVHPYSGFRQVEHMRHIEDVTGVPLGIQHRLKNNGDWESSENFIPRTGRTSSFWENALSLESRFTPNTELFQETEVFFRGFEYVGWLHYMTEEGFPALQMVTKEILPDFLKENGIKQSYREIYEEFAGKQPINTLYWQLRPIICHGVKITGGNLRKPLIPVFEKMPFQVTGNSDFDVKLPLTGIVGKSLAKQIEPWQQGFNVCMNQSKSLLEKELGMFFMFNLGNVHSEYKEGGDTQETVMLMRNMAKTLGFFPTVNNVDDPSGGGDLRNQFSVQNVSHAQELNTRLQMADYFENRAYNAIGVFRQQTLADTKHTTATGIKLSNETMSDQIAYIYNDFNAFIRQDKIQHLNIAQFLQANNYDKSLFFTKDDASIEWLRFTSRDKISLRNIGLTVTGDSKKRKELEEIKNYMLSQNTMGGDSLEFAKIVGSDTMTGLLQAALEARQARQEMEQLAHQNQMQQIELTQNKEAEREQMRWERDEVSKERDREVRILTEEIEATGRAADKDGNSEAYARIRDVASSQRADTKIANDYELKMKGLEQRASEAEAREAKYRDEMALKVRELDLKEKRIIADENIAIINPS